MRIVSLAPSATNILCALGARRHLVGVTRWCRHVSDVTGLPTVGDCWRGDAAKVAALKPDLVIGSVPYKAETVQALLDEKLTFLAKTPLSLDDIFADIRLLGRITGRKKRAEAVVGQMRAEIRRVTRRVRRARRRPGVYCECWPKPMMVSPPWVKELVEAAGGRFVPRGEGGRKIKDSEVIQAKPEIIVLAWAAVGMKVSARKTVSRKGWSGLPAIRDGQVYVISDELLNTPGPILLEGLKRLARVINPEIFSPRRDPRIRHVLPASIAA